LSLIKINKTTEFEAYNNNNNNKNKNKNPRPTHIEKLMRSTNLEAGNEHDLWN